MFVVGHLGTRGKCKAGQARAYEGTSELQDSTDGWVLLSRMVKGLTGDGRPSVQTEAQEPGAIELPPLNVDGWHDIVGTPPPPSAVRRRLVNV